MAFHAFTRSFGQVFGIAIGGTILQNQLTKKLPNAFAEQLGSDVYAAIPLIRTLYVTSPIACFLDAYYDLLL